MSIWIRIVRISLPSARGILNLPDPRRAVSTVTDSPPATTAGASLEANADVHIIINSGPTHEVGVGDSIVSSNLMIFRHGSTSRSHRGPSTWTTRPILRPDLGRVNQTPPQGRHHGLTSDNTGHNRPSRHSGSPYPFEQRTNAR